MALSGFAAIHKKTFDNMVAELGQEILVRQPAPKASSSGSQVSKVLGTREQAQGVGAETTIIAIVSASMTADPQSPVATSLAFMQNSDIYIRLKLADALEVPTNLHSKSVFETAKDVIVNGTTFKVSATARTGLAPLGPYILWVGLKNTGS